MITRNVFTAIIAATALGHSGCGGHRAKFEPGDRVIRKLTGEKAIVAAKMRPFVDDIYWLKMPGWVDDPDVSPKNGNWHLDGPYYEGDLVPAHH